jgi:hypothetical protein
MSNRQPEPGGDLGVPNLYPVVEDHLDRNLLQQLGVTALGGERADERAVAELGQDLRSDPAADVDAAGREVLQRQVPASAP